MKLIMSSNEIFNDVRRYFSKLGKYDIVSHNSDELLSFDKEEYRREVLDTVSRISKNSLPKLNYFFVLENVATSLLRCFSLQDNISKIHEKDKIAALVHHSSGGFPSNAMFRICNSLEIPTFVLQNAMWPEKFEKSYLCASHDVPQTIMCMSEYMKDIYIRMGAEENRVTVTGNPYFDRYKDFIRKEPERPVVLVGFVLGLLECNVINTRIPWFHSPPIDFRNYFRIYEIAEKLPEFDFIIKLKPHDLIEPIHFFDSPRNVRAYKNSWWDWIDKASVVVGATSSVVMESAFAGVPTIIPKLRTPFVNDYMGAVEEIEWDVDNVVKTIKDSVGKEVDNKRFNEYYFSGNLDYNSTERVISTIEGGIV